ncbi:thiamine pyrophosphokinase-like protein 1 [Patellaria atrata CBS 101060]|uniref:Thiamine pyrophosphokinase n=1 Tax=Patellaria atrata CBS 101060 TaxID=1346257 RepID=A0A9P4S736_9PEZI|nr:thiamine pyrophosphokinase-like protein 1 [Patellaria atrata CBS 101060]
MDYDAAKLLKVDTTDPRSVHTNIIILNQPIKRFDILKRIWNHARFRLCVDGGANRLYDLLTGPLHELRERFLPDIVCGDLDSLRHDVRQYYEQRGVKVQQDPDQYSTDFGKAMQKVYSLPNAGSRETIILGSLANRVDQGLGLLHELLREQKRNPHIKLWLFSETSVSFILTPGFSAIHACMAEKIFTENVGLIPIYGPCTITTTGLEWDVHEWPTSMGTQVSTSNHVVKDIVTVTTDNEILFTIELQPSFPLSGR